MPTPSTPKPPRIRPLIAVLFGALHAWLAGSISPNHSATYDEPAHLAAGLSYWREHDFRLQPENGLLPQLWLSLPLVLSPDLHLPSTSDEAWERADIWTAGDQLLHRLDNSPQTVLGRARAMNALLGGVLVAVIVAWAWSLVGAGGGVLAGLLASASPTLLAHSGLATSDTCGALGLLLATLAYWRLLHRVSTARILAAGVAAAMLALSKYSAALFPLIGVTLLLIRLSRRAPLPACGTRRVGLPRLAALLGATGASIIVAWALVWGAYGFRYSATGPRASAAATFIRPWDKVLLTEPAELAFVMADGRVPPNDATVLHAGPVQNFVGWAGAHRMLPEAWLYGFAFVERHSRFRLAYFAGEWSAVGWRTFFPVAYLIKSTPAELAFHLLGLAAVAAAWLRPRTRRLAYRATPLLAAGAIYASFAMGSNLNIGHRHLLPLYALGAVLAAFAWPRGGASARLWAGRCACLALAAGQLVSTYTIRPHPLAYFNGFAGGPDGGDRYLVDSSLDWGQDLPALRAWLDQNDPEAPLYLAYFGNGDPRAYGLEAERIGDDYFDPDPRRIVVPALAPGRYAISATMWRRVYTHVRGDWSAGYETRYQLLRGWLGTLARNQTAEPKIDPDGKPLRPEDLRYHLKQYDHLRFGRLIHQLEHTAPRARVAHNWRIYDLDAATLHAALEGPLRK